MWLIDQQEGECVAPIFGLLEKFGVRLLNGGILTAVRENQCAKVGSGRESGVDGLYREI